MTMQESDIFPAIGNILRTCSLPFEVIGAVAFGSRVTKSAGVDSDFDILIVAEGIAPRLHRRKDEMVRLKRILPAAALDILLLTPAEVASNFENHNPLFLDIAEDGIVLFDKRNLLNPLIVATQSYIRERGIRRLPGGWEFPVKQGVATYLSRVSNEDFAKAMLRDGSRDLMIAQELGAGVFHDKSVYHSQQAIEKCVKAVLIAFGIFQKTHLIGEVLEKTLREKGLTEKWSRKLAEIAAISEAMEPDVTLSRYPGIINDKLWLPFNEYEKADSAEAAKNAEKVLAVAEEFLSYWFSGPAT